MPGLPVLTARTYVNPLPFTGHAAPPTSPDPFVLRHLGRYWCFSTHVDGVALSVSDDLVTWERRGLALSEPDRSEYWAPCVAVIDGLPHLYVSSRPRGSQDPHDETLQVATAAAIDEPFTTVHRFFDTFSIDPHVVRDPSGAWFLLYSTNEPTGLEDACTGTSVLVDELLTPTTLAGRPRLVVPPSVDEEVFERRRFGERDWYTVEGATYLTHGDGPTGTAFVTYSGNAYAREDYFIGYASAPLTGRVDELTWTKQPGPLDWDPLVRRTAQVEGTGHNSVVEAPDLVEPWIVYHGRDAATPIDGTEQRVMRADPLLVTGARLVTPAPTAVVQDAPPRATLATRFVAPDDLRDWAVLEGAVVADGVLRTPADVDVLLSHPHRTDAYVAEVSVRARRSHLGARAGVVPFLVSADDRLEALLDAATASLVVRRHRGGFVREVASWPVGGPVLEGWHVLRVRRTLTTVELTVDGRVLGAVEVPPVAASVGLRSVRTAAELTGFALTDHLDLSGARLRHLPALLSVTPPTPLDDEGVASRSRRPVVLSGDVLGGDDALALDVELLARWGRVEVRPAGPDLRVVVERDGDGAAYRVELGTTTLRAGRVPAHRMSVRVRTTPEALALLVDGDAVVVPRDRPGPPGPPGPPGDVPLRVDLVGARLRGLGRTHRTPWTPGREVAPGPVGGDHHPGGTPVKEQR